MRPTRGSWWRPAAHITRTTEARQLDAEVAGAEAAAPRQRKEAAAPPQRKEAAAPLQQKAAEAAEAAAEEEAVAEAAVAGAAVRSGQTRSQLGGRSGGMGAR